MKVKATSGTSVGRICVYATGQSRVNRIRNHPEPGDEALPDYLRERMPVGIARQVESFRKRAQVSQSTLGELQRLWETHDGESDPAAHAADATFFLSARAKREVDRFHRELRKLPPHVLAGLKGALARGALDELGRPEWDLGDG